MKWYAIFVFTGQEYVVSKHIQYIIKNMKFPHEYEILVPTRTIFEFKKGLMIPRRKALFPGYILVNTNNIIDLLPIIRTSSFYNKVLGQDILFTDIPENEVVQISNLVDCNGNINTSKIIVDKDDIMILNGPLSKYKGKIHKINKRKKRVKILLFFNRSEHKMDISANIFTKETMMMDFCKLEKDYSEVLSIQNYVV